jgi:hypothetical protein
MPRIRPNQPKIIKPPKGEVGITLVEVAIQIPKEYYQFLFDFATLEGSTVEQLIQHEACLIPESIVDDLPSGWIDRDKVRKKYQLPENET